MTAGNFDPDAGCLGKQRFATKAEALRVLQLRTARQKRRAHRATKDGNLQAYSCPACQGFHHGRGPVR